MRRRSRVIWSRPENPPESVAVALGITRVQLGDAIHGIKEDAGLGPRDRVTIWDDGSVTDDTNARIGNVHDEL
jgi:hypothetical protein